jgi:hypothetical protein
MEAETWRPRSLNAQTMRLVAAQAGGAMLGDYFSTSWSGGRAVSCSRSPRR